MLQVFFLIYPECHRVDWLHSTKERTLLISIASISAMRSGQGEGFPSFSLVPSPTTRGHMEAFCLYLALCIRPRWL